MIPLVSRIIAALKDFLRSRLGFLSLRATLEVT